MAYETPLTIAEVMRDISNNKYVLPSIQREYVWDTTQIETLFDSLMQDYPIFEFLPFETLIANNQEAYYKALSQSEKEGKSTKFIEYMLKIIDNSLSNLLNNSNKRLSGNERITIFLEQNSSEFTRKDYMNFFKEISSATASRDLKNAVTNRIIDKFGDKKTTKYRKY